MAKAQESGRKYFGDLLDKADSKGHVFEVAKQVVRKNPPLQCIDFSIYNNIV